jgi:hypothetical protein
MEFWFLSKEIVAKMFLANKGIISVLKGGATFT